MNISRIKTSCLATVFAVFLVGFTLTSKAETPGERGGELLVPGSYVPDLGSKRYTASYFRQRLTERTYFVAVNSHNSLFYVGNNGVIVFDPLSSGSGQSVLKAIAEVTDLPVTALVYSHFHLDHLGDARLFVEAAAERGVFLRIIATAATAGQIQRYNTPIPAPTDVISDNPGTFRFEDLEVNVQASGSTHSADLSWFLLKDEKVLHFVDSLEPEDLIPYFRLCGVMEIKAAVESLRNVLDLDWQFLSPGHGNVGSKNDIEAHLALVSDIRNATLEATAQVPFQEYVNPKIPDGLVWLAAYEDAVSEVARKILQPKYGEKLRFDVTIDSHIKAMLDDMNHYGQWIVRFGSPP